MSRAEDLLVTDLSPGRPGGQLVIALRAEPKTFNPVFATDNPSLTIIRRLMGDLIHIDRSTHRTVAALAKAWSVSHDGRRYTLALRRGIRFSDGHLLDADDVLFSFAVFLDEATASPQRALLSVGGETIAVRKKDTHTLVFELKEAYAAGERLFDSVPILPQHRLGQTFRDGRIAMAWGLSTPAEEIVGLGPFRLDNVVPGERIDLVRNPHYWKVDRDGQRLPYLDRLTFLLVANEDAQTIRFQAGDVHLTNRLNAKSFVFLQRESQRRKYVLEDLGAGFDYSFLFFNLNDLRGHESSEIKSKQAWFANVAFRRAVSFAIDRGSIARLVYQGRASPLVTHVTPASKQWRHRALKPPEHSPDAARKLLRTAGFTWRDGGLHDASGRRVEFSILTSSSNQERSEIATLIQQDLEQIGIQVDIVPLEFRSLVDRVVRRFDYEACILALGTGDDDPNSAIPMITSDGPNHFWRLTRSQALPAWQKEIDRLMDQQLGTLDPVARKRLYDRVQEVVAENLPMIFLISPNVLAGAASGLGHFDPATLGHFTLWNADELYWRTERR